MAGVTEPADQDRPAVWTIVDPEFWTNGLLKICPADGSVSGVGKAAKRESGDCTGAGSVETGGGSVGGDAAKEGSNLAIDRAIAIDGSIGVPVVGG